MKKIFSLVFVIIALVSLVSFNNSEYAFAIEYGKEAKVIASSCVVYQEADFESQTIKQEDGENDFYLFHGDVVDVIELSGDFAKIKIEEIEGFVYKFYLTQNSSQAVYPVFNATIRRSTLIYDIDYEESGFNLKKGDRVFLYEKYNNKSTHTAVQVVLEDGSLYNGYVLTKDLDPDGFSGLLIIAISIIVAGVTIVLSLVFIKKKKKKK